MNGCIVSDKHDYFKDFQFQEYGEIDIRNTLISASRLDLSTLIIDLNVASETAILPALHTYRVQRPNTRIIILAPGRQPGDIVMSGIIALGIYDIVAPDDADDLEGIIPELQTVVERPPASYSQAARWAAQMDKEDDAQDPSSKHNKILSFMKKKKLSKEPTVDTVEANDDKDLEKSQQMIDTDLLEKLIRELEARQATTPDNLTNITNKTRTIGDVMAATLSITYHLLRIGFYLSLLIIMAGFIILMVGKIASIFPETTNATQFLIESANTIEFYLKNVF